MKKEYYGFYQEFGNYCYQEILDINNTTELAQFEFIVVKILDDKCLTLKSWKKPLNHNYAFNILNTDLSRSNITKNNWSTPSYFETCSSFKPTDIELELIDRFNKSMKVYVSYINNKAECILTILSKLEELEEFYNVSHYKMFTENKRLKKRIEKLENELLVKQ